ncbi:hypothetical protein JAAARDRAFT_31832 [Jaapia argillacea MUCL 33604]|uniref:Uncharacterized protein n=1 Tax=Jaapia argillacea MUCL 33604 TaxID=933084 RepID=A0A067QBE8_9AGAM|nr:hypothetical protein JAAARDRAFT_31832 [Jaapia argillacea MUCL 33604]
MSRVPRNERREVEAGRPKRPRSASDEARTSNHTPQLHDARSSAEKIVELFGRVARTTSAATLTTTHLQSVEQKLESLTSISTISASIASSLRPFLTSLSNDQAKCEEDIARDEGRLRDLWDEIFGVFLEGIGRPSDTQREPREKARHESVRVRELRREGSEKRTMSPGEISEGRRRDEGTREAKRRRFAEGDSSETFERDPTIEVEESRKLLPSSTHRGRTVKQLGSLGRPEGGVDTRAELMEVEEIQSSAKRLNQNRKEFDVRRNSIISDWAPSPDGSFFEEARYASASSKVRDPSRTRGPSRIESYQTERITSGRRGSGSGQGAGRNVHDQSR